MYTQISDEMKKMLEADARTFLMKLQSDTFEITSGFRKIVYQGGSSGEGLAIGTTVSASVEITMEKTEHLLTGKEFAFYLGMNVDGKEEYIPMGIFKAQKPAATDWEITLKAYDRMYDAERNYASSLHYPTDTQKVMREIEKLLGISFVTEITPVSLKKTGDSDVPFAGYTIREAIGYVAGLYGKFAIFNRAGQLEFRWYERGMEIPLKKMFSFERNEQDYEVQKVVGSSDSNTSYTTGSGNHGISYSNPFLTKEIVNQIYSSKHGFSYRGGTVTFLGDCRIDPWDMLQCSDLQGNIYKIPAMQITHEIDGGLTTTITAEAEEEDVEDSFSGPTTKAMERTFAELLLVNKLVATKASIEYLESNYIKTSELDTVKANIETAVITNLQGKFATIEYIKANYATIGNLSAANAKIDTLEATALTASSAEIVALKTGIADINTLMFGSASGGSLSTEFSNSVVSMIGDAQIKSAMIESIDASKITALDINTTNVKVHSEDGKSQWKDNTIQIKDGKKVVRVQIGKDASGDYNIYIWDKNGKLMFDPLYGVQEDGIKKAIIRNDMISDAANISGKKIDIASLITTINEDGSSTLKASKIYVDTDKQTLDVSFKTITTKTDTAVTAANKAEQNAGTALSTANSADTKAQSVLNRANAGEFKGDKGDKGDTGATGKGVLSITPQYYLSTSNTAQSGGSWSATRPTWVTGRYYWTRDKMDWSDGSTTYSAPQLATDLNNLYSSLKTVTETVTTQGTNISTIQGQISSKVWQQDITTAVTSLQIGGRNLLTKTNQGKTYWSFNKQNGTVSIESYETIGVKINCTVASSGYAVIQYAFEQKQVNLLKPNTEYMLSFDLISSNTVAASVRICKSNAADMLANAVAFHVDAGTKWVHKSVKLTTNALTSDKSSQFIYINGFNKVGTVYLKNLKLEEGNKATGWTPAPEDVDSSISALEGTTETLNTKYTTLDQTLTSLTATVNNNTTAISKKADGSTVTTLQENFTKFKQDSDTFQTSVSKTYATKTEMSSKSDKIVATFSGNGSSNPYCLLAELKISGSYVNTPIVITIDQRSYGRSEIHILFAAAKDTNPNLSSFSKTGKPTVWIVRTATSTWQLYVKKSENFDSITVTDIINPISTVAITWKCQNAASVPAGFVTATQMASYYNVDSTNGGASGSNNLVTSGALYFTTTIANQTADKFQWIVKSGTSATNFTLTDRVATLLSDKFDITALTTFKTKAQNGTETVINGGAIKANTITADKVLIGEQANLITINPNSEASFKTINSDWSNYSVTADDRGQRCIIGQQTDTYLMFCNYMPNVFAGGDEIYFKGTVPNWGSKTITGTLHIFFYDGNYKFLYDYSGTTMTFVSGTWNDVSGSVTIPSGYQTKVATYYIVGIRKSSADVAIGLKNGAVCQKKKTGQLIVNGTITADKIKVDSLQAICAKIGGFTIDNNNIASGTWGTSGSVMMCTGTDGAKSIGGSSSISGWCFTAGNAFGVTKTGALYASNVKVSGDITATSGTIGKLVINGNYLQADSGTSGNVYRMYIQKPTDSSTWCFSTQYGSTTKTAKFYATAGGEVYCTKLMTPGSIKADADVECKNIECKNMVLGRGSSTATYVTADAYGSASFLINSSIRHVIGASEDTFYNKAHFSGTSYPQIYGNGTYLIFGYGNSQSIQLDNSKRFMPTADNSYTLGYSGYRWKQIYAAAGSISTSDRNAKKDIVELDNRTYDFVMGLKPSRYRFIENDSNRIHYGLIAQDVEELLGNLGIAASDFAGFVKSQKVQVDESTRKETIIPNQYDYGLRYEEFIAPIIKVLQMQDKKIRNLDNMVIHLIGIAMHPEKIDYNNN